jgi:hypothetical protein
MRNSNAKSGWKVLFSNEKRKLERPRVRKFSPFNVETLRALHTWAFEARIRSERKNRSAEITWAYSTMQFLWSLANQANLCKLSDRSCARTSLCVCLSASACHGMKYVAKAKQIQLNRLNYGRSNPSAKEKRPWIISTVKNRNPRRKNSNGWSETTNLHEKLASESIVSAKKCFFCARQHSSDVFFARFKFLAKE